MALSNTLTSGGTAAATVSYQEIKQGDACYIPVTIYLNGEAVTTDTLLLIDKVEFMLGKCVRKVVDAAEAWNDTLGAFLCPLLQGDTLHMRPGLYDFDCRVMFYGGGVLGVRRKERLRVLDANSWEVIHGD